MKQNNIKKEQYSTAKINFAARPTWAETVLDPEIMVAGTFTARSHGGGGRPILEVTEGSGSGILKKYNRFRNNPKAIGKFKGLSGRGSSNITIPSYSRSVNTNTTRVLSTPSLSSAKSYKSGNNTTVRVTQSSNDTTNKLVDIVIQLLAQVVDNTTSIKDIAALLTALVNNKENVKTNKNASSSDTTTKAMVLKALSEAANANTQNTTLDSLIRNVEAIASQ